MGGKIKTFLSKCVSIKSKSRYIICLSDSNMQPQFSCNWASLKSGTVIGIIPGNYFFGNYALGLFKDA